MTCEYKQEGFCSLIGFELFGEYANQVQVNRDPTCEGDHTICAEFQSRKNADAFMADKPIPYADRAHKEEANFKQSLENMESAYTLIQGQA